jgi:hypothetical protein
VTSDDFRKIALSFPGTEERPHFERRAFKVTKGKIFASLLEGNETANIKCAVADQAIYCSFNKKYIYPVPNKFGLQGWTTFELRHLPEHIVADALYAAYKIAYKK